MTGTTADDVPNTRRRRHGVVVVGSANVDISLTTAVLPKPGETVAADSSTISVGGKGANQAVAAAACGAATQLMARIGTDAFSHLIRDTLSGRGVGIDHVLSVAEPTGIATIAVDRTGQNCIVVAAGANAKLCAGDADAIAPLLGSAAVVVLQCESPLTTVNRVIEVATRQGTPVILNPAPCRGVHLGRLPRGITYLVPNESEAAALTGRPVSTIDDAVQCAGALRVHDIDCVIITLGADGCVLLDDDGPRHFPAHRVAAVDTTGAGDAFIGCLAASLAANRTRDEAVRRALLYASLSTTRRGAQISYPTILELERAWAAAVHPNSG